MQFSNLNFNLPLFIHQAAPVLIITAIWTSIWKGTALWKSARRNQLYWFIALILVNSFGILEIVYLLFFQKKASKRK